MKSIRIGNDIRIEWPLKLSGDIERLEDLDLCVEVVPSKEIVDYNNYNDKPGIKVETCTVMLNGGKCKIPSRDALKTWHDRKRPEMSPIILPFTISENKIIAIWKAGDQYSVGEYDIIVYSKKNDIGQSVADQCRFVRLVAHSAQADAPADSDVEAIITLQPLTLELSGLSAYDIAVAEGFEGTRKEWLNSLKSERLGGYKSVESVEQLPQEGEGNIGYVVGTRLYIYVGTGGDTLNGKYKDAGEFKGPSGADGEDGTSPIIRINGNRFEQSTDNGKTWSALSDKFDNRLYIKGYEDSVDELPKNALMGDIYGVGPIYMDDDVEHTKPYYQMYVNTVTSWDKSYTITKVYQGDTELPQSAQDGETVLIKRSTDKYLIYRYINNSWNLLANLAEIYVQKEDIINRGDNIFALVQAEAESQYDLYERVVSWKNFGTYNSISAGIVQELGDGENVVMSQRAVKEAITNTINLTDLDFDLSMIGKIVLANSSCRFIVMRSGKNVGVLECFSDESQHMLTQVFTTHYLLPFSGGSYGHTDDKIYQYFRSYHLSGGTSTIPAGTWGEWQQIYSSDAQVDIDGLKKDVSEIDKAVFPLGVTLSVSPTIVEAGASTQVTISWGATLKGQSINDVASFTLNDASVSGTTSKTETITDTTPTTKTYTLVTSYNGRSNTTKVNLSVVGAMYFGFNSANAVGSLDVASLGKQSLKTSPNGTYTLQNSTDGHYMWLCVPNNMNISRVTMGGFDVPMEAAVTKAVGGITYKCYRSSNALLNGSYTIIIS